MKKTVRSYVVVFATLLFMAALVWMNGNNVKAETYNRTLELNNVWADGEFKADNWDDVYLYKVVLPSDGRLSIEAQSISSPRVKFEIYDKDLIKLYRSEQTGGSEANPGTVSVSGIFGAGTYYVKLQKASYWYSVKGKIRVRGTFTPIENDNVEPNNVFSEAQAISPGQVVTGLMTEDDRTAFYVFNIAKKQRVKVEIAVYCSKQCYSVWDKDYKKIAYDNTGGNESAPGHLEYSKILEAGTYYIKVGDGSTGRYTVQYSLITPVTEIQLPDSKNMTVGAIDSLQATIVPSDATNAAVTWKSGNSDIVSVEADGTLIAKAPGRTKITVVSDDDNNVTAECIVTVSPKKTSLSKVKNISKKQMKITWKKQNGVSGYQIQYSTNKNFKKPKSNKISNYYNTYTAGSLKKKKTYYVRVRAYVSADNETIYGAWSNTKKVKIKK